MEETMKFSEMCKQLETSIESSYNEGVTMEEAEKLAAKFLSAQLMVSKELTKADLDSRMRKSGLKAIRAAVYMDEATKGEKKPTEAMLSMLLDQNEIVSGEQKSLDEAEVSREELTRYYNIFQNAHIYYRGIAKGNFNA
jgi:hypothetical protein